jgi:uncharacterized membrane protein
MPAPSKRLKFRFLFYLGLFLLALVIGTVGFALLEDRPPLEALYYVIVTMSTVGYGDISPATQAGRLLAIVIIVAGVATFLSMIASAVEMFFNRRERQSRIHKLNMVIGLFFSEVGTPLLTVLSDADPRKDAVKDILRVEGDWTAADFARVHRQMKNQQQELDPDAVDLAEVYALLRGDRRFVVGLLENPAVMEHEEFTDVLWATFHLVDELDARDDLSSLPRFDRIHIIGDAQRIYKLLRSQWLGYMEHMQEYYPYLFARAVRSNPFVTRKSVILDRLEKDDA